MQDRGVVHDLNQIFGGSETTHQCDQWAGPGRIAHMRNP